jgi:hypothetical protein
MTDLLVAPRGVTLDAVDELLVYARAQLAKASMPDALDARDALVEPFAADLAEYFDAMAERVLGTVRKALEIEWNPADDVAWTVEDGELGRVLARWYVELGETAYAAVADQLAIELRFDVRVSPAKELIATVGDRVAGISETSRQVLAGRVEASIRAGESIDDLRATLRDLFADWSSSRATTIALTETATVYNQAALGGYVASGLVDGVMVFDGADCGWTSHTDPDLAAGTIRTLDEAKAYPTAHPRCQRAFGPVVAR